MVYIRRETSLVLLDRKILITWGKNEAVVHMAAINPIRVIQSNFIILGSWFVSSRNEKEGMNGKMRGLFVMSECAGAKDVLA